MKLLLINPGRRHLKERDFWDADFLRKTFGLHTSIPLWAMTLAALSPQDVEVKLVDENIEDVDFDEEADLVGIGGMTVSIERAYEIAGEFRKRGKKILIGGIHASMLPEEAIRHADCVVIGEAENVWKGLIDDFKAGNLKSIYKASGFPCMKDSPAPRYDLLKKDSYIFNMIQISRGCPFNCDFCSVKDYLGPSIRCKGVEQVIKELECSPRELPIELFGHKVKISKPLFITDDNISVNIGVAENLFGAIKTLKSSWWECQASINIGKNRELLSLMRDSGCGSMFVGIESLESKCLEDMGKKVNKVEEYEKNIETIQSFGISVMASFIIGSDHEDEGVFERIADFVKKNNILTAMINILTPMPGTRFFRKLEAEGRILHRNWSKYDSKSLCFKSKGIAKETLEEGYRWLYQQIYSFDSLSERLRNIWGKDSIHAKSFNSDLGKMSVTDKIALGAFMLKLFIMTSRRADGFVFNLKSWKEVLKGKGELGSLFQAFILNDFASSLPRAKVDFSKFHSTKKESPRAAGFPVAEGGIEPPT